MASFGLYDYKVWLDKSREGQIGTPRMLSHEFFFNREISVLFLRPCNQLNQSYTDYLEQSPVLKINTGLVLDFNHTYKLSLRQYLH